MMIENEFASLAGVFAAAVENMDALIFVTDEEGGIEYANPFFCERMGYEGFSSLKGKKIDSLYQSSELKAILGEIWENLKSGKKWQGELLVKAQAGEKLWCRTTVSPIVNNADAMTHFVWVQLDITEQKKLEQNQRVSKKRLLRLLDNVPAYIFSKDRDGKYTYANKMLSMLLAQPVENILGKTDFDLFPGDAAVNFSKNDQSVFNKGITIRALEHGGVDEYGIERCYLSVKCPLENAEGEVEELLGMSLDMSEQQRLERALQESETRLHDILDNMKARVYIKDLDFKYIYGNEEVCRVMGTDKANLVGKDDYDLFEPETAVVFRTTDLEALEKKQRVERIETFVDAQTREKRHFASVKVPLFDESGEMISLLGISTDMTEQKVLERALRRSECELSMILDKIKAHVYIKDVSSIYTYVNADMCAYLGKAKAEVVGKTDKEIFGAQISQTFQDSDQRVMDDLEISTAIEKSQNFLTGEECYFWSVKVPLVNELGNPNAILGISTNVSEQKRLEKELRELASTDVLTGIYNRRYFFEVCELEIQRAHRYKHDLSMIMLDVDWFKNINDSFGHAVGDETIKTMTRLCQDALRTTDILGRIGGEEFAILLPETQLKAAEVIAQRIRQSAENFTFDTGTLEVGKFTASFGVTMLVAQDQFADDLLKRADIALYEAKKGGRNRVCIG